MDAVFVAIGTDRGADGAVATRGGALTVLDTTAARGGGGADVDEEEEEEEDMWAVLGRVVLGVLLSADKRDDTVCVVANKLEVLERGGVAVVEGVPKDVGARVAGTAAVGGAAALGVDVAGGIEGGGDAMTSEA